MFSTVMRGGRPRAQLSAKLQEFARQAVQEALLRVNVVADVMRESGDGAAADSSLRSGLALATPPLLKFGGARRVLAVMPKDPAATTDLATLSRAAGTNLSAVAGADNSMALCVEAEQLSLRHIAIHLVQRRRDCMEFAQRVHCRTDIPWTPLVGGPRKSTDSLAFGLSTPSALADPLMRQTELVS